MARPGLSDEELLVRRDKFTNIARQMRIGVPGALSGVVVYAAVLWPVVSRPLLLAWIIALVVGIGALAVVVRSETRRAEREGSVRFWPSAALSAVNGTLWALAAVPITLAPAAESRWPMVYVFAAAVASSSVVSAAASRLMSASYVSPMLGLTAVFAALHETDSLRVIMPLGCLFLLVVLLFYSREVHSTLDDAIRMRHRNGLLAERVAHDATHDLLTGLLNRPALFRAAEDVAERARSERSGYALVYVDLDGFKNVNDVRGHAVGDRVLQVVAERLRHLAPADALLARLGGDEFVLVAEGLRWRRDAVSLAEEVAGSFSSSIDTGEHMLQLQASVGVAWSADGTADAAELLTHADWAMYQAKGVEGARVAVFDEDMRRSFVEHAGLELALRDALAASEFEAWAQPVVTLEQPRLVGIELLIRWRRPGVGLVSPASFMPVAERSALVADIGRFMLAEAAQVIDRWQNHPLLRSVTVSVNIGARHLHGDDLRRDVEQLVRCHPACRDRLVLELTETEFAENISAAAATLSALRAMGVRVAIDDFGTGYSSLAYLQALPADVIKIDRSFVSALTGDSNAAAIVQAVIALGDTFRKRVIAEGVETPEQAEVLRQMGCALGQGYLFGRPMPIPELERAMAAHLGAVLVA